MQIVLASKYKMLYSAQPMNIHSPEPSPEFAEPTGGESRHYSESNPKWFMVSVYRPCPQYDVEVGDYVFRYRPEYGSYFIQESMNGRTLSSISADLSIPTTVIKRWSREIKSFAVSLELSRQHALAYWENLGRDGMLIKGFNMGGWLRTMEIMFKEWAEPEDVVTDPLGIESDGPSNTLIFQGIPGTMDPGHDGAMRGIA